LKGSFVVTTNTEEDERKTTFIVKAEMEGRKKSKRKGRKNGF